ncbi:MAG: NADH-quinone oxidoreductase subunit A [Deltaproteobacteria bacterium]|nr:NADH-quinone oxidoreductase subunit A [Deltaproteobacteria bacterium]
MIDPYISLVSLMVVVAGFIITMLVLAHALGPKNKTVTKQLPFECGSVSVGSVRDQRFNVKFYLVAMLFILFDIEIIFMYPWALVLEELGRPALWAMLSFIGVLVVGLVYVWRKGVLDWNE